MKLTLQQSEATFDVYSNKYIKQFQIIKSVTKKMKGVSKVKYGSRLSLLNRAM